MSSLFWPFLWFGCRVDSWYLTRHCQRKTKGQQLQGKIVSEFFALFQWKTHFSHSSHFFRIFPPRTFPFKTKGFSSRRTKEKKDNKKNREQDKSMLYVSCCTFVLLTPHWGEGGPLWLKQWCHINVIWSVLDRRSARQRSTERALLLPVRLHCRHHDIGVWTLQTRIETPKVFWP